MSSLASYCQAVADGTIPAATGFRGLWRRALCVLVRAHTDTGLSGLGEGTMQWQARTVAAAINHVARCRARDLGRPTMDK